MRLGIYGGTFSPPHIGHVEAAEAFYRELKLDKLLIIPTFIPPHKVSKDDASAADRLNMCKLAFSHIPNTEVSDIEIKRGGKSYTYMTLEELTKEGVELYFLCGTDMILTFDQWKRYEYIFTLATICYARRETDRENDLKIEEKIGQYKKLGAKIIKVEHNVTEVSSSDIRGTLASGNNDFISENVVEYISRFGLYGVELNFDRLSRFAKSNMSEKRFKHTLGVVKAAEKIAEALSPELKNKAKICAYLHDVTKEKNQGELVNRYGISLSDDDLRSPETLHAMTAPPYIEEHLPEYSVFEILSAIKTHTTGSPNMTLLGKILFVADFIEENRVYESSKIVREQLYSDLESNDLEYRLSSLDKAALSSIDYTVSHLTNINKPIHNLTLETRDCLKSSRGN